MKWIVGGWLLLMAFEGAAKEAPPVGDVEELFVQFKNLPAPISSPSIDDFDFSKGNKHSYSVKVEGKDFDEEKSRGCYAVSPWLDVERQLFKTAQGFEVHDRLELKRKPLESEIQESSEYMFFRKDLEGCAQARSIHTRKLGKETLQQRLSGYTLEVLRQIQEKYDESESALSAKMIADQLLEGNPTNKDVLVERVKAIRELGYRSDGSHSVTHLEYIDATLDELLATDGSYIPALVQKAYNLGRQNKLEQARSYFMKAYAFKTQRNHELFVLGGWLTKLMGRPGASEKLYLRSLDAATSDSEKALSYKRLGYLTEDALKFEKAVNYFEKALVHDPSDLEVMANLQVILLEDKKFDEAIALGKKLLKLRNTEETRKLFADAYAGRAEQEISESSSSQNIKSAQAYVREGLKWDPKNAACLQALAKYKKRLNAMVAGSKPSGAKKESKRRPASAAP